MMDIPGELGHKHKGIEMIDAPKEHEEVLILDEIDPRVVEHKPQTASVEKLKSFSVNPQDPTKILKVGNGLSTEIKEKIMDFLSRNLDVFA